MRSVSFCDNTGGVRFIICPLIADSRGVAASSSLVYDKAQRQQEGDEDDDKETHSHRGTGRFCKGASHLVLTAQLLEGLCLHTDQDAMFDSCDFSRTVFA